MSEKIVQLNEDVIKGQLKELVRGSVEEPLLEQKAEKLTQAARYERSETRQGYRSGHYDIVPYGYRLENRGRTNKRNKEVCDFSMDPDGAEVVKVIFQKYVCEGYSSQRVCRYLAEQGFRNRKGGNIPTTSINRIIKNPPTLESLVTERAGRRKF